MSQSLLDTNLIPREIRRKRLTGLRLRFWIRAGGSYVAMVVLASAAVLIVVGGRSTSALSELKDLNQQSTEFRTQLTKIEPQLKTLKQKLDSRKALADQPDPGQLLSLIAHCVDSEVVLRQLTVSGSGIDGSPDSSAMGFNPVKPVAIMPGFEREPRHFDITIRGVSKSEKGVSRLSERLKSLELFDEVELKKTGSDVSGATAVSFEVSCFLRDGGRDGGNRK